MGSEFHCDYCRAPVAIEEGLQKISIGESKEGEACHSCASKIGQQLKGMRAATQKQFTEAMQQPATEAAGIQSAPPPATATPPPAAPPAAPPEAPKDAN